MKIQKGFTLVEFVVTVSIVAVIATTLIVTINPNEIFKQARDSRRMADLITLSTAISLYVNSGGSINMDGQNGVTCKGGSNQKIYISIPNNQSPPQNLPSGWSYNQVTITNLKKIDGSGWLPINFTNLVGGPPISSLPVDPINSFSKNLFYSYTCKANGAFELTAILESQKYGMKGSDPKTSTDGGTDKFLYEVGTDLTLDPLSPILELSFDEGEGTIAYDSSGNNNHGTLYNGPQWVDGKVGKALSFDGNNDYVVRNEGGFLPDGGNPRTLIFWFKPNSGMQTGDIAFGYGCINYEGYGCSSAGIGKYVGAWATTYQIGLHLETCPVNGPTIPSSNADWHLYTAIFIGDNRINFYIDGGSLLTVTPSCTINSSRGKGFSVGVGRWGYYDGIIDEVRIYNRALSDVEIKALYDAMK